MYILYYEKPLQFFKTNYIKTNFKSAAILPLQVLWNIQMFFKIKIEVLAATFCWEQDQTIYINRHLRAKYTFFV